MLSAKHYYSSNDTFYVAVDCIILGFKENELCVLLLKRGFEPAKGKWSLAGGFVKKKESLDQSAIRILTELTGLSDIFMEQVEAFGEIERDPGERVISVAYYALINTAHYNPQLVRHYHTRWYNLKKLPALIFDHNVMIQKSIVRLKQKAGIQPIGFNLLPEHFTLIQLQRLYEAIYQKEFDNRNFRKKILSFDFIEKLEVKDKSSSKRGSFLYKFNKEKYEKANINSLNI